MAKNRTNQFPKFNTLDQLVDFFDNNDVGDYLAEMPEVDFDISIGDNTHLVAVDKDLSAKVQQMAKAEHTTTSKLINKWVREQVVARAQ